MITKKDKRIVDIRSNTEVNMSNWQITHTIDTLTTVNNKFDVLDKINELIDQGIEKRNIFVTDKSFLFSTNYKTYFENGNSLKNDGATITIIKAANIGRIITMEYNSEIQNINCLFEFYKKISSLMAKHHRCRLRSWFLSKAYDALRYSGLAEACEIISDGAIQQVIEIYEKYLEPDYKKRDELLHRIESLYQKEMPKILKRNEENARKGEKKFEYCFERFDRPIIGVYNPERRDFRIINADQMYKNGEESANRIQLRRISKNSPVLITLAVTGVMLATIAYLAYRNHKVNDSDMVNNMADIPQTGSEAMHNILSNEDGSMLPCQDNGRNVDPFVGRLAEMNLEKLERITDKSRVCIEVHNHINIQM